MVLSSHEQLEHIEYCTTVPVAVRRVANCYTPFTYFTFTLASVFFNKIIINIILINFVLIQCSRQI